MKNTFNLLALVLGSLAGLAAPALGQCLPEVEPNDGKDRKSVV